MGDCMKKEVLTGIRDIIIENNYMWIISDHFNCLFGYEYIENKLECVTFYPKEVACEGFAFNKIVKINDDIYFIPRLADYIFCYNLNESKWYKLDILLEPKKEKKNIHVVSHDNCLFCISRFPDKLFIIELNTRKIEVFNVNNKLYIAQLEESKIYHTYKNVCLYKNQIVWASGNNLLNFFNVKTKKFTYEYLDGIISEKVNYTKHIIKDGLNDWIIDLKVFKDKLWIFTFAGKVYLIDNKKAILCNGIEHIEMKKSEKIMVSLWTDIILFNDELICIPQHKNICIKYIDCKQCKTILDCYEKDWCEEIREYSFCKKLNEQKLLLYSYYESKFYILDYINNTISEKTIQIPIGKIILENEQLKSFWIKDYICIFEDLDFLCNYKDTNNKIGKIFKNSNGKRIYYLLK